MNANLFGFLGMDHFFTELLYGVVIGILKIVDFVHSMFNKISGIETVHLNNGNEVSLLDYILNMDSVQWAFLSMILAGMIMLIFITLISVFRSIPNEKKGPAKVLGQALSSTVIMFVVGAMLLVGITLANMMLVLISKLLSNDGEKISDMIFWLGKPEYSDSGLNVIDNFDELWTAKVFEGGYNWFTVIVGGCTMLVILAMAALNMIKRLYDIVLLFLLAPLAASTIPSDDGAKFKAWRDVTIGKVFSAYGTIFAFNIFFLIVPIVNSVEFFPEDKFQNALTHLFMLIGGGLAVSSASLIVSQILGTGGLEGREMAQSFRTMMAGGALSKSVIGGTKNTLFGAKKRGADGASNGLGGLLGLGKNTLDGAGKMLGGHRYTGARNAIGTKMGSSMSNLKSNFMKNGGLAGIMKGGASAAKAGMSAMGSSNKSQNPFKTS